jgi:hypothetical protein
LWEGGKVRRGGNDVSLYLLDEEEVDVSEFTNFIYLFYSPAIAVSRGPFNSNYRPRSLA